MQQTSPTYCIRRDEQGRWNWQFEVAPGEPVAASSKSYASAQECIDAIRQLRGSNNLSLSGTLDDLAPAVAEVSPAPQTSRPAKRPEIADPAPADPGTEEPLDLSAEQVVAQPESEFAPSVPQAKAGGGLTSKKSEDVIITHLRRLQRESGA
jgi:uncharacterized protein YegP (UPF0339 family)